jgi:hypothetical protein
MADVRNIQLGVCSVIFKGVDLGHTIGGVTASYKPTFHKTKVDKYGESVVEQFLVGEELSAELNLAEVTIANFLAALNQGTAAADDAVTLGSFAGKRASANAGHLVLHPLNSPASDTRQFDFAIYKAIPTGELKLEHKNDGEKVLPVLFEGIVDENRSDGNLLGFIGDSIS